MRLFLSLFFIGWWSLAQALPVEMPLSDMEQEARAQVLFHEIRCVVCQSEAIADSPADVAADMRKLVRERLAAGDSNEAIKAYLVSRYGDFILMRPPFKSSTALLWFGPAIILAMAGGFVVAYFRRGRRCGYKPME
jgi:cytochrome c-type biogenesis protein CcmH